MNRGLFVDRSESVIIKEVPEPAIAPKQVRIRAEFASIKHGTEFHAFSGKSPFETQRFDGGLRLFVPREETTPLLVGQFIGNTVVGVVTEVASDVDRHKPGDRVYCYAPICQSVVQSEDQVYPLLDPMTAGDAVCLDPALVSLAAMRDGRVGIADNVVVSGLGAIGLFLIQMLRLAGCRTIVAVDPLEKRRQRAEAFGATLTLDPRTCDIARAVRDHAGNGADIAIEASGNYRALREAMRCARHCGRVVTLGYYSGRDSELELGMEWFHNRLEMVSSLPSWGNPLRDAPLWNEPRLRQTLIEWFQSGKITSTGVLDPSVPFSESADAFLSIYRDPSSAIKLGVSFD